MAIQTSSTEGRPSKKPTVFERAFQTYAASLSEKKNTRKMITDSLTSMGKGPESIQKTIEEIERKASETFSRRAFKLILKPVVDAVSAYAGVIDTMCQADAMPLSIIWGAFRIFIDCGGRFANLFETIKQQLVDLRTHLETISFYEKLYNDEKMQELLCRSYVNVLRFWARVRKECERHAFSTFLKAAGPFSTKKMSAIVLDLDRDASAIEELAQRIERGQTHIDRDMTAQYRAQQEEDRKVRSYNELRHWLNIGNVSQCNIEEANYRRHERNRSEQNCTPGTSEWIFKVDKFEKWAAANSKPSDPILWLSGVPGAGKSVLCSRVIEHIRQTEPSSTAVAYHFFRFDQQQSSTIEVLRVIAIQLLETLWNSVAELPEKVMAITQKSPNNFKNVVEMIKAITSSPAMSRAFVFVDGLDEEVTGRPMDVSLETLDSLISVASSSCSNDIPVRLWLSSQPHVQISRRMAAFPKISFAQQNEADIRLFFERSLPELGEISVDEEEQNHWLTVLKDKAKGNFLWARYMIDNLVEKAESVADIKALIDHTLPPDINEYYRRQLRRIDPDSRDLASKIFSIVCYSRRPVSVSELCDAIGLLRKADPLYQGGDPKPFPRAVRKLLPPMILEEESSSTENRCRLFHSTVKEFLKKNPLVEGISITPSVLADVCLLYLCQPRYSGLLKRIDDDGSSEWKTADGESIVKDHFLQYTAKYWYMHMDNVEQPSDELTDRIRAFLASPNFQTLLQLQYLYVEGQFSVFRVVGKPDGAKFLKRAFPNWFIYRSSAAASSDNIRFLEDYRLFLHEWSHLLQCGCCQNVFCTRSLFSGEIDRCFFGALGDGNFMASMQSRYLSFRFSTDDHGEDTKRINPSRLCYEGYSADGKVFYLMQFASRTGSTLHFICETWYLNDNAKPTIHQRQTIDADEQKANWSFYFRNDDNNVYMRLGRAKPISFDYDARALRIGSQLYIRDESGIFQVVPIEGLTQKSYFEEFAVGRGFAVVASRRKAPNLSDLTRSRDRVDDAVQDLSKLFDQANDETQHSSEDDDDITDSDDDDSLSGSESSSTSDTGVDWTSGAETWSEASTELDDVVEDENALVVFKGYVDSSESDSESSADEDETGSSDDNEDEGEEDGLGATPYSRFMRGYLDDDSDGDDAYVSLAPPWAFGDDDSEDSDGGGISTFFSQYGTKFRHKKEAGSGLEASIAVFTTTPQSGFKCIFRLSRQLSLVLYDSPPVLHPTKPFLVWPMSPGNVLFADFGQKTWFTRKLRPTTSYTRQVFVKCHFSDCGQYLHIAILEARRKPSAKQKAPAKSKDSQNKREAEEEPLELSLFVTTHRLSAHKTTRAPPVQIYRTKIAVGHAYSLPVSRLPFSLTWTPTELYFTQSSTVLIAYRIRLFPPPPGEEAILVPRDPIFLPSTARAREMRLFLTASSNAGNENNTALVLMGSERKFTDKEEISHHSNDEDNDGDVYGNGIVDGWVPRPEAIKGLPRSSSLPLGFYFHDTDVGGWVRSEDVLHLPEDRGVGRLDHKVERFDVEEDCDLEPYII